MKLEDIGGLGVVIIVIAVIIFYAVHGFCLQRISQKINRGIPWMSWVPIAHLFLMCKIAGIRYTWILLLLGVVIPIIGGICSVSFFVFIWYKIARVLNKPGWWGILAMVPLVNLYVWYYLAFSE